MAPKKPEEIEAKIRAEYELVDARLRVSQQRGFEDEYLYGVRFALEWVLDQVLGVEV